MAAKTLSQKNKIPPFTKKYKPQKKKTTVWEVRGIYYKDLSDYSSFADTFFISHVLM